MNIKEITDQLIRHEGLRRKPYHCPAGRLTIGVGRNLEDKGITENEAVMLLENDVQECIADLKDIFQGDPDTIDAPDTIDDSETIDAPDTTADKENRFDLLPESAQRVLVDMRFNLGYQGFRKFKKMIKAVKQQDFHTAAREMKDSRWYHQVGERAKRLTEMMQGSSDTADSSDSQDSAGTAP